MRTDAHTIRSGTVIQADFCIVGAGVAGLILAKELADRGLQVCILESGEFNYDERVQRLNQGENVGYPYYPLDVARTRGVGGSSQRWNVELQNKRGVRLRPLDSIDFEARECIPHSGWPITKADLDPYYTRAQPYFGLHSDRYDALSWQQEGERETLPLNDEKLETVVFQFGDSDHFYKTCTQQLQDSERIEIITNATVLEIETTSDAHSVSQLKVTSLAMNEFHLQAKTYILATGGIEVPRLLLSSNRSQKNGLGNEYDLIGRFFMEHLHFLSGLWIPNSPTTFSKTNLYRLHRNGSTDLLAYLALKETTLREEGLLNYCVSIWPRDSDRADTTANIVTLKGYDSIRKIKSEIMGKSFPQALGKRLKNIAEDASPLIQHRLKKGSKNKPDGPPVAFQLHQMSEQVPNHQSRVTLSPEHDLFGKSQAKLDWKISEADIKTIRRAQQIIDTALRSADLGHLQYEDFEKIPPDGITGGLHHMGTTRMHNDPKEGVVDSDCKVHGIDNLYIASSSVFPTVGYANPTLTIAALTIRLAEHLRERRENQASF